MTDNIVHPELIDEIEDAPEEINAEDLDDDIDLQIARDVEAAEKELLESIEPTEEPAPVRKEPTPQVPQSVAEEKPLPLANGRKPRKEELISSIMQLQELVENYETRPISHYRKMKVAELKGILGDLQNRGTSQILGESEEVKTMTDGEKVERITSKIDGGKILFNMNLMMTQFLEVSSVKLEDKIRTNLYGLTDDVLENRRDLEEALNDIYHENEDWLGSYLSGTNRYMMIMGGLSMKRLIENKKNGPPSLDDSQELLVEE